MNKWKCNAFLNFLKSITVVPNISKILIDFAKLHLRKIIPINTPFNASWRDPFSYFWWVGNGITQWFLFAWNSLKRLNIFWGSGGIYNTLLSFARFFHFKIFYLIPLYIFYLVIDIFFLFRLALLVSFNSLSMVSFSSLNVFLNVFV